VRRRVPFRRLGLTAALLGLAAVTGACTTGDDRSRPAPAHVTAVVLPFLSQMPFHIAAAEGYFADEGLDVEFIRLGRNQDMMTVLALGDADVAGGLLTLNELGLIVAGTHLRVVAALSEAAPDRCTFAAVVARRSLLESGALTDPAQVKQLRFDLNPFIPLGYAVDELVQPLGLHLEDLDAVDLPPPATLEALRQGAIDVTVDAEPWISQYIAGGQAAIWRDVADLIPHYVHSVLMFGPTLVDGASDVGDRFMAAMLRAMRQFRGGRTPRNLEIAEAATGLSPEQLSDACWPVPPEDGRLDAAAFHGYQEWSVEHGLLDHVVRPDELLDQRFVDHANAALARRGGSDR
jgi:NitT/TauT family transport system substrate-binding protein